MKNKIKKNYYKKNSNYYKKNNEMRKKKKEIKKITKELIRQKNKVVIRKKAIVFRNSKKRLYNIKRRTLRLRLKIDLFIFKRRFLKLSRQNIRSVIFRLRRKENKKEKKHGRGTFEYISKRLKRVKKFFRFKNYFYIFWRKFSFSSYNYIFWLKSSVFRFIRYFILFQFRKLFSFSKKRYTILFYSYNKLSRFSPFSFFNSRVTARSQFFTPNFFNSVRPHTEHIFKRRIYKKAISFSYPLRTSYIVIRAKVFKYFKLSKFFKSYNFKKINILRIYRFKKFISFLKKKKSFFRFFSRSRFRYSSRFSFPFFFRPRTSHFKKKIKFFFKFRFAKYYSNKNFIFYNKGIIKTKDRIKLKKIKVKIIKKLGLHNFVKKQYNKFFKFKKKFKKKRFIKFKKKYFRRRKPKRIYIRKFKKVYKYYKLIVKIYKKRRTSLPFFYNNRKISLFSNYSSYLKHFRYTKYLSRSAFYYQTSKFVKHFNFYRRKYKLFYSAFSSFFRKVYRFKKKFLKRRKKFFKKIKINFFLASFLNVRNFNNFNRERNFVSLFHSKNNFFIYVHNANGKIIYQSTNGLVGYKGPKKPTAFAAEINARRVAKAIHYSKVAPLVLVIRTRLTSYVRSAIRGINYMGIKFSYVKRIILKGHNGLRKPGARRV
jgi:small subunit ribosomal protein S11